MSDGPQSRRDRERSAAGELRTYAQGQLAEADHKDISRAAVLAENPDLRHLLEFAERAYNRRKEPDEPDFWNTEWAERRLQRAAGDMATDAVRAGNVSQMEHITGQPTYRSDVSGFHTFLRLESWLLERETAKMVYIAGHQGSGKTDFGHLLLELVAARAEKRGENATLASNVPTSQDTRTIQHYDRLRDWFTSGDSGEDKWMLFDEASSELSGYSHDADKVQQYLSGLIKRMRKNGCNLIVIGHTGKDVHPDIRRLADYVQKPSKKTARAYTAVSEGEGVGHKFDLDGVPPTSLHFDTEDEAEWYWRGVEDDVDSGQDPLESETFREWRNQKIERMLQADGITQKQVSAWFDISARQVRRITA